MSDLLLGRTILRSTIEVRQERELRPDQFPFTGGWVQRMSRKLGQPVGEKRALRIVRELVAAGDLVSAGSYRQHYTDSGVPSGFRVALYRLRDLPGGASHLKASVRRPRRVKRNRRPRWWEHAFFGMPDGRPPPHLTKRQRRMWRSRDEQMTLAEVAAWA